MEGFDYSSQQDLNARLSPEDREQIEKSIREGYGTIPLEIDEKGDLVRPDHPKIDDEYGD